MFILFRGGTPLPLRRAQNKKKKEEYEIYLNIKRKGTRRKRCNGNDKRCVNRNTNTDAILLCNYHKTCEEEMRETRCKNKKKEKKMQIKGTNYRTIRWGRILINLELCSLVQLRKEREKEEGEELLLSPDKTVSNGGDYS